MPEILVNWETGKLVNREPGKLVLSVSEGSGTQSTDLPIYQSTIIVDCRGEICPVPLVEVRKAIRKAAAGDVIEVFGTHPASKKEIPMAVEALGLELLSVEGTDTDWTIRIQR